MNNNITIKEVSLDEIVEVNATIVEFDKPFPKAYFEERCQGKDTLPIVAYVGDEPAGYMLAYDKFKDGSFYCWMAGVNENFRKRGVLKFLMNYQDNWAKNKGYNKIKIKTRNGRREMISYLVKYGFFFTQVDSQPNVAENRIHLEKIL